MILQKFQYKPKKSREKRSTGAPARSVNADSRLKRMKCHQSEGLWPRYLKSMQLSNECDSIGEKNNSTEATFCYKIVKQWPLPELEFVSTCNPDCHSIGLHRLFSSSLLLDFGG